MPEPNGEVDPGDEDVGLPRWVKVSAVVAALVVAALMLVAVLAGSGAHGPGRHVPQGTGLGDDVAALPRSQVVSGFR